MKTLQTNYADLTKRYVRDMVLFNNLPQVDEFWYEGLIVSPLLQESIDAENAELKEDEEEMSIIDFATDGIYQTYIIDDMSALDLYNHTREIISYSEKLDSFFLHVTHFGTMWSGVHAEYTNDVPEDEQVWDVSKLARLTQG